MHPLTITDSERNVLYVTIVEAHVNQHRRKKKPCSVQCRLQMRDNSSLNALPCVALGCGPMATIMSEVESCVYWRTNDPVVEQVYRVLLPSDIKTLLQFCDRYAMLCCVRIYVFVICVV